MMTLHGVDVFLRTPEIPDIPKTFGAFTLVLISNRGSRVYPPPVPEMELSDWQQCRYLCDDEVSDAQIDELLGQITSLGWQWTKTQKLFKIDGDNAFSQPY